MSKRVFVLPPDMTHTGKYQIREAPAGGYAKADGSLTQPWEPRDGLRFDTFAEALRWAKASPRGWQVLNENDPNFTTVRKPGP